ncbi:MAG: hypothetical protein QGF97_04335 [Alphaproteobacteria bacterium]|nr:hypothetical protein [Alphaproteobacteria bacterium]MDP7164485.1 hypothetical protein [Alphaproteobacteria bacterium]MDP7429902.1 hypothetical protein [Alphaproteobacteria bacterium]|tara:strand:+ start:357 stop:734 length:378 start_codon:yes stop_codon:yes gene_type:complete
MAQIGKDPFRDAAATVQDLQAEIDRGFAEDHVLPGMALDIRKADRAQVSFLPLEMAVGVVGHGRQGIADFLGRRRDFAQVDQGIYQPEDIFVIFVELRDPDAEILTLDQFRHPCPRQNHRHRANC